METYKLFLLLFTITTFISYITFVWSKFGVLDSISDSYYKINNKALFTLFIWSIAIPVMIIGNTTLMFLAGSFLAFVGAAPAFKEKTEGEVHVIGAVGGILLGFLSLWLDFHMPIFLIIFIIFLLYALPKKLSKWLDIEWLNGIKHHTWWVEIAAFILILTGLGIAII
jgi:hypothetical protein